MSLRRPRSHRIGISNIDFRTKRDTENLNIFEPWKGQKDLGTMGYKNYKNPQTIFKKLFGPSEKINTYRDLVNDYPDPRFHTTAEFYNNNNNQNHYKKLTNIDINSSSYNPSMIKESNMSIDPDFYEPQETNIKESIKKSNISLEENKNKETDEDKRISLNIAGHDLDKYFEKEGINKRDSSQTEVSNSLKTINLNDDGRNSRFSRISLTEEPMLVRNEDFIIRSTPIEKVDKKENELKTIKEPVKFREEPLLVRNEEFVITNIQKINKEISKEKQKVQKSIKVMKVDKNDLKRKEMYGLNKRKIRSINERLDFYKEDFDKGINELQYSIEKNIVKKYLNPIRSSNKLILPKIQSRNNLQLTEPGVHSYN